MKLISALAVMFVALFAAPALASAAPVLTVAATHSGPFAQGDTTAAGDQFSVVVSNTGDAPSSGTVTVTDRVHNEQGLNYVSTTGTDASWACSQTNSVVTCTRSDALAAGASYPPILINVSVNSTASLTPQNLVSVSGGNTVTDPITVVGKVDLVMHNTFLQTLSFRQGDHGDGYQLTVYNQGAATTTGTVTATATIPAGLSYNSVSGSGWTCAFADPTLTCTRSDGLRGGGPPDGPGPYSAYPEIYLYVDVANNAPASVTLNSGVTGGGEQTTPTPQGNGANTSNRATPVTPVGDVNTTVTTSGSLGQGGSVTYTITPRNSGAGATLGPVVVSALLGAGLTATYMDGPGWTCDVGTVSCSRNSTVVAGGTLDAITLTAAVSRHAPGAVSSVFTISGGGELNTADDVTTVPSTIVATPDLEAAMAGSGSFNQGETGTLTLTNSNTGYAPTSGTRTATVSLPHGFTATAIAGTGWTCTLGTLSCVRTDALAAGASDPAITVTLAVGADAPTDARFIGRVSGGGELYDGNDSTYVLEYIGQKPDLTVGIVSVGTFQAGGSGRYTITASNSGLAATNGSPVTVTATVPAGLSVAALGGNGWACSTSTMSCTRSDVLAAASDYPAISLFVDISLAPPASVTTKATVAGGGEANTGNDSASVTTAIAPAPGFGPTPPLAAPVAVAAPLSPVLPTVKSDAPTLRANGTFGIALTCAKKCTVQGKLVLSKTSARALHLRSRTVRTLSRTVSTSAVQKITLSLPASVRRVAKRHHVKSLSATLTFTVRDAAGRRATHARSVHLHV